MEKCREDFGEGEIDMKILGIIGSYRKFGNSEVMVREALLGAKEEGAETEVLRLTDYRIEPCRGCLTCVFKKTKCVIQDGASYVFDKMKESDGFVVGAPAYILGVAGIFKMLSDRSISLNHTRELAGRPAVAIAVAGVRDYEAFTLPGLNMALSMPGIRIVDQFVAFAQGPGEVALNEDYIERAHRAGRELAKGLKRNEHRYIGDEGTCPICHLDLLEITKDRKKVRCPLCLIEGSIEVREGKIAVEFENTEWNRWCEEERREHTENRVLSSGPKFMALRDKIREKIKKYKE